ncbi:hypothetical protein SAMN05444161_6937 [Rhizobiales bacterium GAS191]|nr:hypothetical protein SAMN05519103_06255 [Rhizobiales bacterium GAS113]SEE73993.1 hypothetical protein SAMN05444161_6937 [Rhizobiales bacterium GAS191]
MAIRRLLEGSTFAPETVQALGEAYQGVVEALGLRDRAAKEEAAQLIIGLATSLKTVDAAQLRDEAIAKLKDKDR